MSDLPSTQRTRIAVIDVLRGLIMMIMLVDHVREAFFAHHPVSDPLDLSQTEPALFFTRSAAHFCAPLFVFLTGLSAWLYAHPASGPRDATGFLFKRGLLLVALELTLVNFAWYGVFPPATVFLQVIWVIGLAMMVLALLHRLPPTLLAGLGLLIVAGHNALSGWQFTPGESGYSAWTLLLHRGYLLAGGALQIKVSYPLLPWIGVILLGYVTGQLYGVHISAQQRTRWLGRAGGAALLLLLVLRFGNFYGETQPWQYGASSVQTLMSFLNFSKYPPSLDFLLMTLGIGAWVAAWLERCDNSLTRFSATLGSAPMFYYLLHLYVLLLLQKLACAVFGPNHGTRWGVEHVWQVWALAGVLLPMLYPWCARFARYKRTSGLGWLRYF